MSRIVLHRVREGDSRPCIYWFTFAGQEYGVMDHGPGYGYEVMDLTDPIRIPTVRDGYMRLSDLREQAPQDILYYLDKKAQAQRDGFTTL